MNVGRIYALTLRLLADFNLGEELTKEIFITTWKRIEQMRDDITFAGWLKSLAVSTALDKFRNKDDLKKLKSTGRKHEKIPKRFEATISLFDRDIFSLPERERIIFVLHDLEKYSDEEIADMLMLSKDAVKENLKMAQQLLETSTNNALINKTLQEKIDTITLEINPQNDLWSGIFNEVNKMKIKTQEEIKETESFQESKEEDNSEFSINKKSKHYFGEIDEKQSEGTKKKKLSDYLKRFRK